MTMSTICRRPARKTSASPASPTWSAITTSSARFTTAPRATVIHPFASSLSQNGHELEGQIRSDTGKIECRPRRRAIQLKQYDRYDEDILLALGESSVAHDRLEIRVASAQPSGPAECL